MAYRSALTALQVAGMLSLIPFPFILVANVMQIAAPKPAGLAAFVKGAGPYILLSLYPLVWIVLDALAWGYLRRGEIAHAFAFSAVPVLASLAGVLVWQAW